MKQGPQPARKPGAAGMTAREVIECPHCGEATQVNRLPQGRAFCSCAAERPLPTTGNAADKEAQSNRES
ncbi:MAG: hypothetical protein ACK5UK_01645 [bacterium]